MSYRQLIIVVVLIAVLSLIISLVQMNPPLEYRGGIRRNQNREIELDFINTGKGSISLRNVLVNGTNASQVELKLKRTPSSTLPTNANDYSVHEIGEYKIKPLPSENETKRAWKEMNESGETNVIFGYTVRIINDRPVESVTIQYSYYGLPFQHTIEISPWS
ncbi:MAG: hypothetical protein SCK29_13255 [Bacillota bacterium]|nr:hypothetical protein [Bacillota bacterium]MDW7685068.1 hypothetical protein [Bacillota bacterium]